MNELEKKIQDLANQIKVIDQKVERIEQNKKERENEIPLGMISIVDGNIKMELLLSEELFNEEDMKELEKIAIDMQMLVLKIQERIENK